LYTKQVATEILFVIRKNLHCNPELYTTNITTAVLKNLLHSRKT